MRIGVVDVGSNTARLLVADVRDGVSSTVRETRAPIGLGAEIERHGMISATKIAEVSVSVGDAVATARAVGVDDITVLVTSPGRQSANGDELARAIVRSTGVRARLLTAAEEAWLAYAGALAATPVAARAVAVCDVGGGSAQIAIGSPHGVPTWIRSLDVGSLRLTRRHVMSDPPRRRELDAARSELDTSLDGILAPTVTTALATGGTARSLQKLVGVRLGLAELAEALEIVSKRKAKDVERTYGVPRWRARLLPAGATILAAIQHELGVELEVAAGGLREGAALELAEHLRAAARRQQAPVTAANTRWIDLVTTDASTVTDPDDNALAKAAHATPFKRPENGLFRPGSHFEQFYFDETGDTNNQTTAGQTGGFGGIFRLKQDPTSRDGSISLFYLGDETHSAFDNTAWLSDTQVAFVEDAGDTLHGQRNALDSGWLFDATANYANSSAKPTRFLAQGRDASATLDSSISSLYTSPGFYNDGDNEITGTTVSDGDPGKDGVLGARIPKPFRGEGKWRAFYTQQHGDNVTYELIRAGTRGDG